MMDLMDLVCKVDMFFDAVLNDADMLDFFAYITGSDFQRLLCMFNYNPSFKYKLIYFNFFY
jgi:hypothetical protein